MPFSAIDAYLERLEARMAEAKLMLSDAVSYPHLKDSARSNAAQRWMQKANARQKARPATPAILKLMGIGVEYV
jgi:hypothetical protein